MYKEADNTIFKELLSLVSPFATADDSVVLKKLPQITDDPLLNKATWNGLVAGTTFLAGSALLKAITHKLNARKWQKKSKRIASEKTNALYPQDKDIKGIDKKAFGMEDFKKATIGAVPVMLALSGALFGPSLIEDHLKHKDRDDLELEIDEKKKKLAQLRRKIISLQLDKTANDPDGDQGLTKSINYILGTLLSLGTVGAFALTSHYHKRNDKNIKIMKAAESLAERNLTNIPQRISLHLTSDNKPKISKKDKEWDKLTDEEPQQTLALNAPPINDDFSDKITKVEKDVLFS